MSRNALQFKYDLCINLVSNVGPSNMHLSVCLVTLFGGNLEETPVEEGVLLWGSHQTSSPSLLPATEHSSVMMLL